MNMTWKKWAGAVLSGALLCGLILPAGAEDVRYTDTDGHWGKDAIERWSGCGIVSGVGDGAFQPEGSLTRGQMAAILTNLLGLSKEGENVFTDLPADKWYTPFVLKCSEAGVLSGDGQGHAMPEEVLTRAQALTMLCNALKVEPIPDGDLSDWMDGDTVPRWAVPFVAAMEQLGVRIDENHSSACGLNGGGPMTRAYLMQAIDQSICTYIDKPGSYRLPEQATNIVVVNSEGVTLTGSSNARVLATEQTAGHELRLENAQIPYPVFVRSESTRVVLDKNSRTDAQVKPDRPMKDPSCVRVDDLNHKRVDPVTGEEILEPHSWSELTWDGEHHWRTCTGCGVIRRESHDWGPMRVNKAPGYDSEGQGEFRCKEEGCGASRLVSIPRLPAASDSDAGTLTYLEEAYGDGNVYDLTWYDREPDTTGYWLKFIQTAGVFDNSPVSFRPVYESREKRENMLLPLAHEVGDTYTVQVYRGCDGREYDEGELLGTLTDGLEIREVGGRFPGSFHVTVGRGGTSYQVESQDLPIGFYHIEWTGLYNRNKGERTYTYSSLGGDLTHNESFLLEDNSTFSGYIQDGSVLSVYHLTGRLEGSRRLIVERQLVDSWTYRG